MVQKRITYFLLMSLLFSSFVLRAESNSTKMNKKAVYELIERVIPTHASKFKVEFLLTDSDNKDLFEIETKRGEIILRGNNGVSVASALNYYLKNYTHSSITWNGTNLNLPKQLPTLAKKITKKSPYKHRYYLNYCTFNYSMSWWDWERWQKEIDWMAMNGINMPLAVTGQNSIWQRVYNKLGFSNKELESFFSGPAYFNWFWMGNLDGWGGPLPQSFMDGHEALQKKILAQERVLGMTPILPAFTGHVPPTFTQKFPDIKTKKTTWVEFPEVNILDPNHPMFIEIGKLFMEEQIKTYGTNHYYSADTFNENTPPTTDSMYLNDISQTVYQSMALSDPKAIWIMQGWLFYHDRDYWKEKEIKALLNAVPNDKMILLDLWSERFPIWSRTNAYYGKPWIWNMLHNFGQNTNISGLMSSVANNPAKALNNPNSGKMLGIGLTMEGIEQNPVIYDLMLENVWRDTPIDLNNWLKDYAFRRYMKRNLNVDKAWELLSRSVYADSITNGGSESIITARPTFKENPGGTTTTKLPYDPMELVKAWYLFNLSSTDLADSDGFKFDFVDLSRQVLANYASKVQQQMSVDYENKNLTSFKRSSQHFLELIADMDDLVATRKDFLLGNWLEDAKKWGTTAQESALYEQNARNLITLWGDKDCRIHEYACKQWSGMLNGFYKVRWQAFVDAINADLKNNRTFDQNKFDEQMKEWEWKWINSNEIYTTIPKGDAVKMAKKMYEKYYQQIVNVYSKK
jgi:alpha-N-acetylglucosaminidase